MTEGGKFLTGIERHLVLQYLADGNAPVTITDADDKRNSSADKVYERNIFPVAIHGDQISVMEQGIILLENPPDSVKSLAGKTVKVQFYFNRLGLYFTTVLKTVSSGLALVVPGNISRIEDKKNQPSEKFSAVMYFRESSSDRAVSIKCSAPESYRLFFQPSWNDIPDCFRQSAKSYLEKCVDKLRAGGNSLGNGLFLIPLCRFLSENDESSGASVQGRKHSPKIIYIDHERLVLGFEKDSVEFYENTEYSMILAFPILRGPLRERTVCFDFKVLQIFSDEDNVRQTAVCCYDSIQEEDVRFLAELKVS